MRIEAGGYVGIGTADPDVQLSVYTTDALPTLRLANDTNSNESYIRIQGKNSGGTKQYADIGIEPDTGLLFFDNDYTNRRMVILNTGNVGIGTTGPAYTLQVSGDIDATRLYVNAGGNATDPIIRVQSDTDTGIYFPSDNTIALSVGASEALRIDSNGDVGIGTTNPTFRLDVSGSAGGTARFRGPGQVTLDLNDGVDNYIVATGGALQLRPSGGTMLTANSTGVTVAGTIQGTIITPTSYLGRSAHHTGHLVGGYQNLGDNALKTTPIFTMGSSYNPDGETLSNMYGIGHTLYASSGGATFLNATDLGTAVAADG
jgi:hypothetical protein